MLKRRTKYIGGPKINDIPISPKTHPVIQKEVSELTTKFFGIIGPSTPKKRALLYAQRLIDSVYDIENIKVCENLKKTVEEILSLKGKGLELFLGYLIEKLNTGKVKVILPPAEMDYLHSIDLLLNIGGLNIATDLTIQGNGGKCEKYKQHCNAMTNPNFIPKYLYFFSKRYSRFSINTKNYSPQFIPNARLFLKIGQKTYIKESKNNIFLETYKIFIRAWNKDSAIEETLGNEKGEVKKELEQIANGIVEIIEIINKGDLKFDIKGKRYMNQNTNGKFFTEKTEKSNGVYYNIEYKNNENLVLFNAKLFIPKKTWYK